MLRIEPAIEFLNALEHVIPGSRLLRKDAQLAPYESDALTAFRAKPLVVVLVESNEEVIRTVKLCHEYRVPFVARGSGTSLSGGSLPIDAGVVIAMNRLNKILRLDPRERIAVVQPGVTNLAVSSGFAIISNSRALTPCQSTSSLLQRVTQ